MDGRGCSQTNTGSSMDFIFQKNKVLHLGLNSFQRFQIIFFVSTHVRKMKWLIFFKGFFADIIRFQEILWPHFYFTPLLARIFNLHVGWKTHSESLNLTCSQKLNQPISPNCMGLFGINCRFESFVIVNNRDQHFRQQERVKFLYPKIRQQEPPFKNYK